MCVGGSSGCYSLYSELTSDVTECEWLLAPICSPGIDWKPHVLGLAVNIKQIKVLKTNKKKCFEQIAIKPTSCSR